MSLQGFCTLKPKTLQTEILGAPLYHKHSNGLGTFSQATNYSILRGQGVFNTMAWTMANPSVVISYLAISLDVPVVIAGLLVTIRQSAALMTALFGTPIAARRPRKRSTWPSQTLL